MTMKVYPNQWRWQDNLERARMLLCLSWLVRVEDTPEHREWLTRVTDDLLAWQQRSGALRERLAQVHSGHFRTPQSNEEYGTGETPLLQQDGDPVTDQLYTTGFALLGLHEAVGATGDPKMKRAEDKLAEYLCRDSDPFDETALSERHLVSRLRRPPLGGLGQFRRHRLGRLLDRKRLGPGLDGRNPGLAPAGNHRLGLHRQKPRAGFLPKAKGPDATGWPVVIWLAAARVGQEASRLRRLRETSAGRRRLPNPASALCIPTMCGPRGRLKSGSRNATNVLGQARCRRRSAG